VPGPMDVSVVGDEQYIFRCSLGRLHDVRLGFGGAGVGTGTVGN